MKRKHLCLAGYTLAAFAAVGCSQKGNIGTTTSVIESSPSVQQTVTTAWEADRAGDSEQALALYLDVLGEDPSNAWAKRRVEQLSAEMPTMATRRLARVTKQPLEAVTAPKVETQVATPAQPAIQQVAKREEVDADSGEADFKDWFQQMEAKKPAAATAPVVAKAEPKPQRETASTSDEFAWAQPTNESSAQAAPEPKPAETTRESVASRPQQSNPFEDEAVFDALDAGTNPFEKLAEAKPTKPAATTGAMPWDTAYSDAVVQADSQKVAAKSAAKSIERVAFSPAPEPAAVTGITEGTRLVDLCKDANVHVLSLVHQLESPLAAERREALIELGLMGGQGQTARLPVRMLFDDQVEIVSAEAAWTLWQIDGDVVPCVRRLSELTDSKDAAAAELAIQSLGLIGEPAIAAAPALRDKMNTATGVRRVRIAESLVRIQPEDVGALQSLIEATRYGRPQERAEATYALAHTPELHLEAIVPVLVNALHDENEAVRTAAALTLGNFGDAASHARLALEAAVKFDRPAVRDAARATLACLPE